MKEALNLSQQQQLVTHLTPQQVQFVRLLEMSTPEVEDEVRRVVDENPALEVVSDVDGPMAVDNAGFNETAEQLQLADYRSEDDIPYYRLEANNYSADDRYYEPVAVNGGDSLSETLMRQLGEYDLDDAQYRIASHIVGNLDDNGYLTRPLGAIVGDIAVSSGVETSVEAVKEVFNIVRSLDPPGVGAVDLRDCLLLQLNRREPVTFALKVAREIIADWFDLFSKKHYDSLCSHLELDKDALREALDLIKTLNPKPGAFAGGSDPSDRLRHITPDFNVESDDNGSFVVSMPNRLPELAIERSFELTDKINTPGNRREREARAFIRQKHDDAVGFIRMLSKRSETLFNVMQAIVKLQPDFFRTYDTSKLKPMILKDIAAITGYDLSVISRATSGKYVMTPHGMFPLKIFFNERPKEENDTSSHEILDSMRRIIEAEDGRHPLSDEAIKDAMVALGYDIARRTVAKYRERLGFPVARLRKQL